MVARCIRLGGEPFYAKTYGLLDHYVILTLLYGLLARPTKIPLEYPSGTLRFKLRFLSD